MIRKIYKYDDKDDKEVLSQISSKVENIDDNVKNIIQDLKDTLHSTFDGRGISAIQIGEPLQICVCSWAGEEVVMINPVITRTRGNQEYLEGCLSVPGVFKKVSRYQKVWCTYLDENGEQKEIAEGGRMSNIIQHELDHFSGICKLVN